MHVTGADGADFVVPPAEGDEGGAAFGCQADRDEPLFGSGGMFRVRGNVKPRAEHGFNLGASQALLLKYGGVPLELDRLCIVAYDSGKWGILFLNILNNLRAS